MRTTALLGALLVLAGCGGKSALEPGSLSTAGRPTAQALSQRLGCVAFQPDQETELFVREQGECAFAEDQSDSYPMTIYVFTNAAGRDNWLNAASSFGAGPMVVGPLWVVAVGVDCDPARPCDVNERTRAVQGRLGGEIR
jgi:hypothetical protein